MLHHEIWSDEAQVWMLCKNLSITELFTHLHNEGHPIFYAITLFLLANTHAIMFGFVSLLVINFIYEIIQNKDFSKKNITSTIIMCCGLLAVAFQLYDVTNSNYFIKFNFSNILLDTSTVIYYFFQMHILHIYQAHT